MQNVYIFIFFVVVVVILVYIFNKKEDKRINILLNYANCVYLKDIFMMRMMEISKHYIQKHQIIHVKQKFMFIRTKKDVIVQKD